MDSPTTPRPRIRIAVLVSGHGRGTNLQAILDACSSREIPGEVALVLGVRSDAPAMERARCAAVPTVVVSPRKYPDDADYGAVLLRTLGAHRVDLICLAGYMRLLPPAVVATFAGRIMNTHPALLPLFGGPGMYGERVHEAVIASGMKVSGCTVHFVDDQYDHGPIILQTPVLIEESDTAADLAARVLPQEHGTYVRAIRLFAEGRLRIEGNRVRVLEDDQ
jgi:formyltetrahydrofolate-dependent phosphoribosylglycinamide formyltransferase